MPYLTTRDDTRLFYLDGGAGRPILFVASAWLNSRMWEFQLQHCIDQGYRCIAYDRRGHGRSDWPWAGYDYDTLADDLAALIEHLELQDVVLVSHSAGAGEIVRYLTRHGAKRVAGVAVVSGTTPFPMKTVDNPDAVPRHLMEADMALRTKDRAKWFAENAEGFFGIGLPGVAVSPEYVQYMIGECLSCSAHATAAFFSSGFTSDFRQELGTITVPTLVVHGDHDAQAPLAICGARTAQLVPKNTFLVYDNAAHGLFITHADRLNRDLCAFVQAVSRTSAGVEASAIKI
jgi:pimeloyl-ACP methyl ester carboxylesterase